MSDDYSEKILHGISASPGICIGKAYLVDHGGVDVVEKYFVSDKDLPAEIKRFKAAVKRTMDELNELIKNSPEELRQHTNIFESHVMLLKDKMLYDKIIEKCTNEHINAEWAVKKVISDLKTMFQNMTSPYLKARMTDIVDVSDKVMRNLVGGNRIDITDIKKRVILVAKDLSPAETSQIDLYKIQGFVTDRGGKTSHTSIIARALGIPAVLGLKKATDIIKNDDLIVVDGTAGVVIIHPTEETLIRFDERKIGFENYQAEIIRESHLHAATTNNTLLRVMGNIELPEEVSSVLTYGGDGIGLYRTEFQYLNLQGFPKEDELFNKYKSVAESIAPRPVTIRTLDINGDKAIFGALDSDGANPVLGLRAIRYCLEKPEVFKTQLKAILRAAAFGNVRILFPMISCYDEIIKAKELLNEAAETLDKEGAAFNSDIKIGIMVEVPSAVIMADLFADAVDFFSIGTNDLIQYSLAIDRGNNDVAYLYDPLNPAVIRLIKYAADAAKYKGIEIAMCGEMAAEPIFVPILLGLGMEELSMTPQSIPAVKSMIRSLSIEDTRLFVKDVLKQTTSSEILELLKDTYGSIVEDKVYRQTV